jgi:hypothetical protein
MISPMLYEDLVRYYENKTEEELLRLQLDAKDLTPEATVALTNELTRRRITPLRLQSFRNEERERKEELSKQIGRLFIHGHFGVGRWYLGKSQRSYDASIGKERFKTTIFILFLWLPLIPTGTYLIERKPGYFTRKITVLRKVSLDWAQVLRVWLFTAVCLLALALVLRRL